MIKVSGKDTARFVEWAILKADRDGALKGASAIKLLEKCGLTVLEEAAPKKSGPLQVGERVRVDKNKNANPENVQECEQYHDQVGLVQDVLPPSEANPNGAVLVQMVKDLVLFQGTESGKKTGIYRGTGTPTGTENRKPMVEIVYFKDVNALRVDTTRLEQAEKYMDKATESDERSLNYYTGRLTSGTEGKEGFYFKMEDIAQRAGGFGAFNIEKGRLLYVGLLNKRPGGWEKDLEEMREKIMGE
jgi:hypothetical protein